MRSFMLRHKGAEFRLYGGEAVPAPLKGDRLKGRQPEARGFSRVRLHCVQGTKEDIKEHIMSAMRDEFKKRNMNVTLGRGLINEVDDYLVAGVNISGIECVEYMSISAKPVQMQPAVQINLATLNFKYSE